MFLASSARQSSTREGKIGRLFIIGSSDAALPMLSW